jgi:hypothetical protein
LDHALLHGRKPDLFNPFYDTVLLKGNQGTLHADVRLFLDDPETKPTGTHTTVDGDHGRIETRTCTVSTDVSDALDTGLDLGDPPLRIGPLRSIRTDHATTVSVSPGYRHRPGGVSLGV